MRVFISYSSRDSDVAQDVATGLQDVGIEVSRDQWDMRGGDPIVDTIADWLKECDAYVLLASASASESPWVAWELAQAEARQKEDPAFRIIPVRLDGSEMPDRVPARLIIDWRDGPHGAMQRLRTALESTVERQPPSSDFPPPWFHQKRESARPFIPVYVFALDPPISAARIETLSPRLRRNAEAYGQAMIKLVLLVGANPVISENQIYDSRAVMSAVADAGFRQLLEERYIVLSYRFLKVPFVQALDGFLQKEHAITSAWAFQDRTQLRELLKRGADAPADWGEAGDLLEALRYLDGLPRHPQVGLARRIDLGLPERILRFVDRLPDAVRNRREGERARDYVRAVHGTLNDAQRGDRSAWIRRALDPAFYERLPFQAGASAREITVSLALLAYQEIVCESVAGGNALRSVASVPAAFDEAAIRNLESSQLQIHNVKHAGVLSAIAPDQPGRIIRFLEAYPPTESDLRRIAAIPWKVVHEVVCDPEFRHVTRTIPVSDDARNAYLTWLRKKLAEVYRREGEEADPDSPQAREDARAVGAVLASAQGKVVVDTLLSMASFENFELAEPGLMPKPDQEFGVEPSLEIDPGAADQDGGSR